MSLINAAGAQPVVKRRSYVRYVGAKILGALASLFFVLVVNFFLFRVIPGDPARTLGRGRFRTPEQLAEFKKTYGLDQSLPEQFLTFLKNTFTGELGVSLRYRVPVADLISDRFMPTLLLVGTSTLLAIVIGVYLGIVSGWNRGKRVDKISTSSALTLYSMPEWWLGLLFIAAFAVGIGGMEGIFPTGGLHSVDAEEGTFSYVMDTIWHLTLPVITLTLAYLADYALIMRSSLLDELGEDYLVTARAKGLRDVDVRRKHAVRNALLPTTTVVAISIGSVVGGAITIETIFSIPGLGLLASEALILPDYWVLQGVFLVVSAASDLRQPRREPRLRPARPPGAVMTESTAGRAGTPTARQLARRRRAEAWRRNWRLYRAHRSGMVGLVVLLVFIAIALFAPLLASPDSIEVTKATGGVLEPPSSEYWLGTDESGRSVLALVIWGARISLFVGLCATIIAMVIGTTVGLMSGFFEGWPARVLYRLTEWVLVIPFLVLAIVMSAILGRSLTNIVLVIGITSWPGTALIIRSQTLSIKERPYLERAKVLGAGRWHQMTRHILPNVMPMVFANTTLTVSIAILTETTLSFLGLGDPTRVSWGSMLEDAFDVGAMTTGAWWYIIPPGLCVVAVVLSVNLVGQALEEIFNPRLRRR